MKLLVIDDDEHINFSTTRLISKAQGHEPLEYCSARDCNYAKGVIIQEDIDIVLCDMYFDFFEPKGLELLKWFRDEISETKKFYIISAAYEHSSISNWHTDETVLQCCNRLGATGFLQKPLFIETIERIANE